MKTTISLLFILILASAAFGQKKPHKKTKAPPTGGFATRILPEVYSSVYDIRNFTRCFIFSVSPDAQKSEALISKVLAGEPSLSLVADAPEAQFYVHYREEDDKVEMRVWYLKDKKVVVVWAEEAKTKNSETKLAEKFLKVLRRNKKLDAPDEPGDA